MSCCDQCCSNYPVTTVYAPKCIALHCIVLVEYVAVQLILVVNTYVYTYVCPI